MEKTNRIIDALQKELALLTRIEQTLYNSRDAVNYDDIDYRIIKFQQKSLQRMLKTMGE